ncbi:MAG: hypothetical protein RL761_1363, partial [Pseudomonadota bacterium]
MFSYPKLTIALLSVAAMTAFGQGSKIEGVGRT